LTAERDAAVSARGIREQELRLAKEYHAQLEEFIHAAECNAESQQHEIADLKSKLLIAESSQANRANQAADLNFQMELGECEQKIDTKEKVFAEKYDEAQSLKSELDKRQRRIAELEGDLRIENIETRNRAWAVET
jgi:hypothetical protein